MKKYLNRLSVFKFSLKLFSIFSRYRFFNPLTYFLTATAAKLNLFLNKPVSSSNVEDLAKSWESLMPSDAKDLFRIRSIETDTAIVEIHLLCPLRNTGNVLACYRLMNYDRTLLRKLGGQLIVLESQACSRNKSCKLAIRKRHAPIGSLIPAHLKKNKKLS